MLRVSFFGALALSCVFVGCGNEPLLKQKLALPPVSDDEGADEEPVDEEPVDEEPVDEEPVDEEPVDEEPVDEEPVDEEPAVDPRLPVQPTFACAAGAVVEMEYLITSNDMRGASATGPGRCFGSVKFADDLAPQGEWSQFHYADDNSTFLEPAQTYNGSSRLVAPPCGEAHCANVGFNDGSVRADYCTIVATCDGTTARAIGYTW